MNDFKDIRDVFSPKNDDFYLIKLNSVAIEVEKVNLDTCEVKGYVTRMSYLNKKCHTDFSMESFKKQIQDCSEKELIDFAENFSLLFKKETTSNHLLFASLHTLYAYSLGLYSKPTMMINTIIHDKGKDIAIEINCINQEIYAFTTSFLKVMFNSKAELDYDFLSSIINDRNLMSAIQDYYQRGITSNYPSITKSLLSYLNR